LVEQGEVFVIPSQEPKRFAAPTIYQGGNLKTIFAKQRHAKNADSGTEYSNGLTGAVQCPRTAHPAQVTAEDTLTLAWADSEERKRIIDLSIRAGRQTMNLRTRKGAEVVVLRRSDGQLIGWTGVDIKTDPLHPELFSQFVYPQFRGVGLGRLLEHFWWAYLDGQGYSTGFMRMELDCNQALVERRLRSGYCRLATAEELGQQFVTACHDCELFGKACRQRIFLAVDVHRALAARRRSSGPLDINSLPLRVAMVPEKLT